MSASRAERIISEAFLLEQAGRLADAAGLYQSLVHDVPRSLAYREPRERAFKGLLRVLYLQERQERTSKVFKQYCTEYAGVQDPGFDALYLGGLFATRTAPLPLRRRDRFWHLLKRLESALSLPGLVAECGCFQGLSSYLLCSRLRMHDAAFDGRGFEIYDSFKGLSMPQREDMEFENSAEAERISANISPGKYAASLDYVKRALSAFPGIAYFPGWIPESFLPDRTDLYRFVHVDVDLYQPTKDSLEYFWPRLVPGGVIMCDDYNWPGAKRALEQFCGANHIPFEITPVHQAYLWRTS